MARASREPWEPIVVGGTTIHDAITDREGRVARLAASELDNRALVTELYWAALCRPPGGDSPVRAGGG